MGQVKKFNWPYFVPAIAWAIFIMILCSTPSSQFPTFEWGSLFSFDKLGHFSVFAILSGLMTYGMWKNGAKLSFILILIIISLASLYGFTIEILQGSVFKERYFEILDIIANIIGSIVGALAFTYIKK